jgi:hypothetical protein
MHGLMRLVVLSILLALVPGETVAGDVTEGGAADNMCPWVNHWDRGVGEILAFSRLPFSTKFWFVGQEYRFNTTELQHMLDQCGHPKLALRAAPSAPRLSRKDPFFSSFQKQFVAFQLAAKQDKAHLDTLFARCLNSGQAHSTRLAACSQFIGFLESLGEPNSPARNNTKGRHWQDKFVGVNFAGHVPPWLSLRAGKVGLVRAKKAEIRTKMIVEQYYNEQYAKSEVLIDRCLRSMDRFEFEGEEASVFKVVAISLKEQAAECQRATLLDIGQPADLPSEIAGADRRTVEAKLSDLRTRQAEAANFAPQITERLDLAEGLSLCLDRTYLTEYENAVTGWRSDLGQFTQASARADVNGLIQKMLADTADFRKRNRESIKSCTAVIEQVRKGKRAGPAVETVVKVRRVKEKFVTSLDEIDASIRVMAKKTLTIISKHEREVETARQRSVERAELHSQLNSRCPKFCNSRRKIVYQCSWGRVVVTKVYEQMFGSKFRKIMSDAVEAEKKRVLGMTIGDMQFPIVSMRKSLKALKSGRGSRDTNLYTLRYCACGTNPDVPKGCKATAVY